MHHALRFRLSSALCCTALLAACGGGGGSGSMTPATAATVAPSLGPLGDSTLPAYTLTDDPTKVVGNPATIGTFPSTGRPDNQPVDGLVCGGMGALQQHFHGHITVIANGTTVVVPSGIGMYKPTVVSAPYYQDAGTGGCDYEIHVHSDEAVIHIESTSSTATFNVKEFFDMWGQPISANGFGPFTGVTRIFVTDQTSQVAGSYTVTEVTGKDLSTVPLTKHDEITVEIGPTFVPIPNYIWGGGLY